MLNQSTHSSVENSTAIRTTATVRDPMDNLRGLVTAVDRLGESIGHKLLADAANRRLDAHLPEPPRSDCWRTLAVVAASLTQSLPKTFSARDAMLLGDRAEQGQWSSP